MAPKKSVSKTASRGLSGPTEDSEKDRVEKLILAVSEKAPPKVAPYMKQVAPVLATIFVTGKAAWPHIVVFVGKVQVFAAQVPEQVAYAILGIFMCFFGGVFPATIAAVEAWRLCGGVEAWAAVKVLYAETVNFSEASAVDDKKDADNDGVADVDVLSAQELLLRKTKVALEACNPIAINGAVSGIYLGWVGVLATLRVEFAKTVTLGASIGTMIYKPCQRYVEPTMKPLFPEEHQKWVPVVMQWICKTAAISFAWMIQRVISAFHSAIRGGLICGRSCVLFANQKGWIQTKPEDTHLDEIIGWACAALGFLVQLYYGFFPPFLFRLFLWPVQLVEYYIVWQVMA